MSHRHSTTSLPAGQTHFRVTKTASTASKYTNLHLGPRPGTLLLLCLTGRTGARLLIRQPRERAQQRGQVAAHVGVWAIVHADVRHLRKRLRQPRGLSNAACVDLSASLCSQRSTAHGRLALCQRPIHWQCTSANLLHGRRPSTDKHSDKLTLNLSLGLGSVPSNDSTPMHAQQALQPPRATPRARSGRRRGRAP